MHEEANYDFYRMPGLTPAEIDVLNLGYLVRQEQKEQASENAKRGRKYTEPAQTTTEAVNTFTERANG